MPATRYPRSLCCLEEAFGNKDRDRAQKTERDAVADGVVDETHQVRAKDMFTKLGGDHVGSRERWRVTVDPYEAALAIVLKPPRCRPVIHHGGGADVRADPSQAIELKVQKGAD